MLKRTFLPVFLVMAIFFSSVTPVFAAEVPVSGDDVVIESHWYDENGNPLGEGLVKYLTSLPEGANQLHRGVIICCSANPTIVFYINEVHTYQAGTAAPNDCIIDYYMAGLCSRCRAVLAPRIWVQSEMHMH